MKKQHYHFPELHLETTSQLHLSSVPIEAMLRIRPCLPMTASMAFRSARRNLSSNPKSSILEDMINIDGSKVVLKRYHQGAIILAVLAPAAFMISPSPYNMPIDLTLGFIFPLHAHVGLNAVISDYVPKVLQTTARVGLLGVTGVTLLGLLKLNVMGPGLTESIKSLWRKKPTKTSK